MTVYYWLIDTKHFVEVPIENVKSVNYIDNIAYLEKTDGTKMEIEANSISYIEEVSK